MGRPEWEGAARHLRENGFAIVPGLLGAAERADARALAAELIDLAGRNASDVFTRHYLPHRPDQGVLYDLYQRFPEFVPLARHPVLLDAIRAVYAANFFLYENSLVYKPRQSDNAVPWHQDFMSRPDEPFKLIAWMALDDVDRENGCMWVLPGSHREGYRSWYKERGQTHHTRTQLAGLDTSEAVPVELQAGDVLLFHCALLHSSQQVDSTRPRRAYRVAYQSFESARVPRGSPLVVSLADRSELLRPHDYEPSRLKWLVHRIGRRMLEW